MRRGLKARVHAIVRSMQRRPAAPIDASLPPPEMSIPFVDRMASSTDDVLRNVEVIEDHPIDKRRTP